MYTYVHCHYAPHHSPHTKTNLVFSSPNTVFASLFHNRNCKKISPTITQLAGEYPHIKFVKVSAVLKCFYVRVYV